MHFFMIELALNSSCHMRIVSIADDLTSISDYMGDVTFMELFRTPADWFPFNYWLNFFLSIADQIDWHVSNLKRRTFTGYNQSSQALACRGLQDSLCRILNQQVHVGSSFVIICFSLAVTKVSSILLWMVLFMVSSFSPSGFSPPCICVVADASSSR